MGFNDPFYTDPWNPISFDTPAAKLPEGGGDMRALGLYAGIGGVALSAIGAYFGAEADKYQMRSQELAAEFQASMSQLNQRMAEQDASRALEDGQTEAAVAGIAARAEQASTKVATAVSGFAGSAEVEASQKWAAEVDQNTISLNAFRKARAARAQATNYRNEAAAARGTAMNARASRRSISPFTRTAGGLLSGVSVIAGRYVRD